MDGDGEGDREGEGWNLAGGGGGGLRNFLESVFRANWGHPGGAEGENRQATPVSFQASEQLISHVGAEDSVHPTPLISNEVADEDPYPHLRIPIRF